MNEELPQSRSSRDFEKAPMPAISAPIPKGRKYLGLVVALIGIIYIVVGVIPMSGYGYGLRNNSETRVHFAPLWFGTALLYCAYLSVISNSRGRTGVLVGKGCFGSLLFAAACYCFVFGL